MRIVIDWDLCQGHANCMGESPEVFQVSDEGKLTILQERPDESQKAKIDLAVRYCPTGAIAVEND